jgi:hypothetical protein
MCKTIIVSLWKKRAVYLFEGVNAVEGYRVDRKSLWKGWTLREGLKRRACLKNEDIKTRQLSTLRMGFPQKEGSYPHFYVNALAGDSFRRISNKDFP